MVTLDVDDRAFLDKFAEGVGLQFCWVKCSDVLLEILHDRVDLIFA